MSEERIPGEASPAEPSGPESELAPEVRACGNCRMYTAVLQEAGRWMGDCRVMRDRGMIPATAPACGDFLSRHAPLPKPGTRTPPRTPPVRRTIPGLTIHRSRDEAGGSPSSPASVQVVADGPIPELENMTREELKEIIREALYESETRLAPRWEGGKVVVRPANEALQSKEIPIDALFHKVVMVRDRLRVLEQKINGHEKLSDVEKVDLQQYITKCYGSLTTFNFLFADKSDFFEGEKSKE